MVNEETDGPDIIWTGTEQSSDKTFCDHYPGTERVMSKSSYEPGRQDRWNSCRSKVMNCLNPVTDMSLFRKL